ncbi:MAG: hypothetical protein AB7T63_01360 [Planctomycetota bacterium]
MSASKLMHAPLGFARRVLAWSWKELRERLPVVIGIAVALPLLYVLAITTFSSHLSTAPADKLELTLAGVTLLLVWFGLAGDTLAGEVTGGGPSLVRRQPHGMLSLFVAKLLVLGAVTLGLAWYAQYAFSWTWQVLASEPLPASAARTFRDRLADGSNAGLFVTWLALPLLSWPLVTGAWIGRCGAASLAALLLVGMLAVPAWLVLKHAPWLLPWSRSDAIGPIALALGLIGVGTALVSWLVGWGRQRRPWTPALAGAATALVCTASIGGWAYADFRAWSVVRPDDSLRIAAAYMGADGESLWLTVHKGVPFANGEALHLGTQAEPDTSGRGTPIRTWRVDLKERTVDVVAEGEPTWPTLPFGCATGDVLGPQRLLCPTPVLCLLSATEDRDVVHWYDTRDAQPVASLPHETCDARAHRLLQTGLRELAVHRDSAGRRVWIRHGQYEREGAEEPAPDRVVRVDQQRLRLIPVPGGWSGVNYSTGRQRNGVLDRDGQFRPYAKNEFLFWQRFLDASHYLDPTPPNKAPGTPGPLRVVDVLTDETVVECKPPGWWTAVGLEGLVLVASSVDGALSFSLWDPIHDSTKALTWKGAGIPLSAKESVAMQVVGRRPDGRLVLYAQAKLAMPPYGHERSLGVMVLDPARHEIRPVLASPPPVDAYVALDDDGSLVVIEDCRRIVRHGPELGQRQVLFPFPRD